MKHWKRLFGGIGTLFLVYVPLRLIENKPAICFIVVWIGLSYMLGFLLDRIETTKGDKL